MVNKVLTGKGNKKPRKDAVKKNGTKIMKKVMDDADKLKETAKECDVVLNKIFKDLYLEHPKDYVEPKDIYENVYAIEKGNRIIWIHKDGNDSWPGTIVKPMRTVAAAERKICQTWFERFIDFVLGK